MKPRDDEKTPQDDAEEPRSGNGERRHDEESAHTEVTATLEQDPQPEGAGTEPPAEAGKAPEPPPDPRELRIRFLERQLQEREQTLHAYIKAHKKAEAEYDTFKQRMERDKARELMHAKGRIVERLLEVDEHLERTIEAATRGSGGVDAVVEGVRLVHRIFVERLTELGLERVDPQGQVFDPNTMEALSIVPVSDPSLDNRVVHTMRAGFRIGEHEIRPALVQVGRRM